MNGLQTRHGHPCEPAPFGVPATWAHPATIARGTARLRRDYPRWQIRVSRAGQVWACRKGPWTFRMTIMADNPGQMRALLLDDELTRAAS